MTTTSSASTTLPPIRRIELPDVNVLIALHDTTHPFHKIADKWYQSVGEPGWATCPLTENGFIRIVSTPIFPSGPLTSQQAAVALAAIGARSPVTHHFVSDSVSLGDTTLFDLSQVVGHKQITDVYLLGLCQHKGLTLVTLDKRMTTAAIMAPHPDLLQIL